MIKRLPGRPRRRAGSAPLFLPVGRETRPARRVGSGT